MKRLKDISSFNDDVLRDETPVQADLLYVDIGSVDGFTIVKKESVTFGEAPSRARRLVRHGDIIVSTVRTYLRAIARISNPEDNLVVSTGFVVIRPLRIFDTSFAGYVLMSSEFIDSVISRSVGVSYPAINASDLMRIAVPLPPVPEQRAIAAFLDAETAKIDTLIEEQRRLIELLKEKRQAVISHAVTKGLNPDAPTKPSGVEWLGDVPAHWEVKRLGSRYFEANDRGSDSLPVLQVSIHSGVSDKELTEDESDRKITRIEDKTKYKRVNPNDLVYNMMRAWQGGFGAVTVEGMVSPAYVVARPRTEIMSRYVEYILRSPPAVEQMRRFSHGVTDFRLRLYWHRFKTLEIPVPDLHEQYAICDSIESMTNSYDELQSASEHAIALLQERRSALISAAVTGKIDVRDYKPDAAN